MSGKLTYIFVDYAYRYSFHGTFLNGLAINSSYLGTYSQCVPFTCLYLLLNAEIALIQHFVNKKLRGMFVEKIGRPYLTLLTHIF